MAEDTPSVIPPTPDDAAYEAEARAQEAFGAEADQGDVFGADDPFSLFADWMALAGRHEINDPNAAALATVDADGLPDVRMVLLKALSNGFVFYTNSESAKGRALLTNPAAALCFHWKSIRRQVRVRGPVAPIPEADSDAYFAKRSRSAQIGAWASEQSRSLSGPDALRDRIAERERFYADADKIPRPDHWYGFALEPQAIEFWVNRPYRLHDRLLFTRSGNGWATSRLYP